MARQCVLINNSQHIQLQSMASSEGQQPYESLAIWKVKLELAAEGSYQAIQQVKEHVLEQTDSQHPIFKQSFYEILQQGYQLHQLPISTSFPRTFQTFKDFPLFFLVCGKVEVKCINLEGDTETILQIKSKGLVTIDKSELAKRFGQMNINLITKFQILATQQSILLEIQGSNKLNEIMERKQITQKQLNVMKRFMLFPSKQVVRVTVNNTNQDHIKDRVYLMQGKACYYLDDEKQFGKRLILACFEEGYLNPKQFQQSDIDSSNGIPSSFNILEQKDKSKTKNGIKKSVVKMYIFQQSQIMYLQQNFLKDDLVKAIQLKRQQHIKQVMDRYRAMADNMEDIEAAQNQIIIRFKLNKKQVNSQIHRIVPQPKVNKGFLTAKQPITEKKNKSRNDLISTSSSIKCSIRIRKSKKVA